MRYYLVKFAIRALKRKEWLQFPAKIAKILLKA